jgi:hypothetical protein
MRFPVRAPAALPLAARSLPLAARSLRTAALLALAVTVLVSCKGDEDDTSDADEDTEECGDVDGPGGDTGDVPNVLGAWTVTFGSNIYDDNTCNSPGLTNSDLNEFLSGAMTVGGRVPNTLVAEFSGFDTQYWGLENHLGGIVFTGVRETRGHTLYISFGGHLYEQPRVDRTEIRGFGYVGVDVDSEDGAIDCWLQGDWKATKSGN